jgi:hypothetical protein
MAIDVERGHYLIAMPKMLLVLTKAEFVLALRRGKAWKRRRAMASREVEAAVMAAERRAERLQDQRPWPSRRKTGRPG